MRKRLHHGNSFRVFELSICIRAWNVPDLSEYQAKGKTGIQDLYTYCLNLETSKYGSELRGNPFVFLHLNYICSRLLSYVIVSFGLKLWIHVLDVS